MCNRGKLNRRQFGLKQKEKKKYIQHFYLLSFNLSSDFTPRLVVIHVSQLLHVPVGCILSNSNFNSFHAMNQKVIGTIEDQVKKMFSNNIIFKFFLLFSSFCNVIFSNIDINLLWVLKIMLFIKA